MQSCFFFFFIDLKVYDDQNTEVDEDAFDYLINKPNLGMLEVPLGPDPEGESLNLGSISLLEPIVIQHKLIRVA